MFESMTYENILNNMLNRIPADIDRREGSIIYDALAPAAAELCQMYISISASLNECFADTASREYLIKRAKERGIYPKEATRAVFKGKFNAEAPVGSRFTLDSVVFEVLQAVEGEQGAYRLLCLEYGSKRNHVRGRLVPVDYIDGLSSAFITELLIPGEDDEDTEIFRKRYMESFKNLAFAGNLADYTEKITAIAGVGGVKVFRAWEAGGYVRAVVITSEYTRPSEDFISDIQNIIDPEKSGLGLGLAPIGHRVTIEGVEETAVSVSANIVYAGGWGFEDALSYIEKAVDEYLYELRKEWAMAAGTTVRLSYIESRILELDCVVDISGTRINGIDGNLTLEAEKIPVRGEISG